jgi:hypothetical protein
MPLTSSPVVARRLRYAAYIRSGTAESNAASKLQCRSVFSSDLIIFHRTPHEAVRPRDLSRASLHISASPFNNFRSTSGCSPEVLKCIDIFPDAIFQ